MAVSLSHPYLANAEPEFRALPTPHSNLRASIIIPARDEAQRIAAALDALARQRASDGSFLAPSSFEILLLCNNCRDDTAEIACRWARAHPHIALHVVEKTLVGAQACVGAARKMLMDAAYERLQIVLHASSAQKSTATSAMQHAANAQKNKATNATENAVNAHTNASERARKNAANARKSAPTNATKHAAVYASHHATNSATGTAATGDSTVRAICSTDADSRASEFWLAAIWAELENGAHAVGGRILVERAADDSPAVRRLYLEDTTYRLLASRLEARLAPNDFDPWPRHFQFFGASLAVTPQAYAHVGGLPRADCLEDMALGRALTRADVPLRHSPWVRVTTSARREGRVGCGLSTQLAQWDALGGEQWTVASGAELVQRYQLRRRAHGLFCAPATANRDDYAQLAAELFLPSERVRNVFGNAAQFGALWDDLWADAEATAAWKTRWPHVPIRVAVGELRALLSCGGEK